MDVFQLVRAKLPAGSIPEDTELAMYVAEVGQTILTYCNRSDMPAELVFLQANMVVDYINGQNRSKDPEAQAALKSVKEGDVQVTFEAVKASTRESLTDSVLFNHTAQLNRFRKMRR